MKKHIKAVDARGRKLGGETPLLCTPLVGRTRERVLAEAASVLRQKPDLVEWRVDFFDAIGDTDAVIETARALRGVVGKRPVIFTRRAERGGGERTAIGDAAVVELYDAVAASGLVDFIDFETDNDPEHLRRVREARGGTRSGSSCPTTTSATRRGTTTSSTGSSRRSGWAPTWRWCRSCRATAPTCCGCSRQPPRPTTRRAFR